MLIHSNTLTAQDIRECVPSGTYLAGHYDRDAGVDWASIHQYGSRSRDRAFSVRLSGSSKYTMRNLPDKGATWDEWGIFIAELYRRDPEAIIGHYKTLDNFIEMTDDEHNRIKQYRPDMLSTHSAPWLKDDDLIFQTARA